MDLCTPAGALEYLKETRFASHKATLLTGGTTNSAYRLHLKEPYEGCNTLVMKHTSHDIPLAGGTLILSTKRQDYEAAALRLVHDNLPRDEIVTVPAVHFYDEDKHVLIMDDCGENSATLKQLLIDQKITPKAAQTIGKGLGRFLVNLHGLINKPDLDLELFHNNDTGRSTTAVVTYGRLESTLSGKDGLPTLADPPLSIREQDMGIIRDVARKRMEDISSARDVMTHGDFWTGNVVVHLKEGEGEPVIEKIHVLDWELAKTGLRALDVGQMCAELHLVQLFHPESPASASAGLVLSSFLEEYKQEAGDVDAEKLARDVMIAVGTHMVVWVPRVPSWRPKERTREVVEKGVEHIVDAATGPPSLLESCLARHLTN